MNKISSFIIVFLLVTTGFFVYHTYQLKQEMQLINEGYDNNIQYAITLEDSIVKLNEKIHEFELADKFSVEGNPKAKNYLQNSLQTGNVVDFITNTLMKTNTVKGNNPLVPFDGMDGEMKIEIMKILNNRWIIARFSDGTNSGEMILKYFINPDKSIDFEVIDQTLF
jgi:hypothetical protein